MTYCAGGASRYNGAHRPLGRVHLGRPAGLGGACPVRAMRQHATARNLTEPATMRFLPTRFAVAAIAATAAVVPPAIALAASAVPDCQGDALWRFDAACLATTRSDLDQQQADVLAALRQAADPRRRELLASAQAAWTAYRQAQCESEADLARAMHADDGAKRTMAPSDRLRCEVRLSQARLMELQAFAKRASR